MTSRTDKKDKLPAWVKNWKPIIIRRRFFGKEMTPEEAKFFCDECNKRRPYSGSDFVPQHFLPDLSKVRGC